MGSGGHNRTSAARKRRAGTVRRDRLRVVRGGKDENPDPQEWQPPSWLGRVARAKWAILAPVLQKRGILTDLSIDLLANACMHWELYVKCYRTVSKDGLVVKNRFNRSVKHPAHQLLRENASAFRECLARMGMTPVDLGKLDPTDAPDDDDAFFR